MINSILLAQDSAGAGAGGVGIFTLGYLLVAVVFFYFVLLRPQNKKEKERTAMISSVEIGDRVLTTSGFYGVVLDVLDDKDIVVEFGNNKNCRIVMVKSAIAEIEKPE